ncbi:MAG: hypothetical protein FJW96_00950 [Actinobacteria bacterium]|nr:hypothetical protein [Actinomycetota bacterium]
MSRQPPVGMSEWLRVAVSTRLMFAFALSQTKVVLTPVAAAVPVLQTRTPTGNSFGPTVWLLLSRPITFQVIGVIVSTGATVAALPPAAMVRAATTAAPQTASRRIAPQMEIPLTGLIIGSRRPRATPFSGHLLPRIQVILCAITGYR